jgi:hypothetical protein
VVNALFNRLGNAGVLVLAGVLLLGGLAGAAAVHQYDRLNAVPAASQHQDENHDQKPPKKNKHGKPRPSHPQQQRDQATD